MSGQTLMVVGSLTRDAPYFKGARGGGSRFLSFDEDTGRMMPLSEKTGITIPPTSRRIKAMPACTRAAKSSAGTRARFPPIELIPKATRSRTSTNSRRWAASSPITASIEPGAPCSWRTIRSMPNPRIACRIRRSWQCRYDRTAGWARPSAATPIRAGAECGATGEVARPLHRGEIRQHNVWSPISEPTSSSLTASMRRTAPDARAGPALQDAPRGRTEASGVQSHRPPRLRNQ